MGEIRKFIDVTHRSGGFEKTEIYPVTSVKAVYNKDSIRLDHILKWLHDTKGVINISDLYKTEDTPLILSLQEAIKLVDEHNKRLGFIGTFLNEKNEWVTYKFIGDTLDDWENPNYWTLMIDAQEIYVEYNSVLPFLVLDKNGNKILGIDKDGEFFAGVFYSKDITTKTESVLDAIDIIAKRIHPSYSPNFWEESFTLLGDDYNTLYSLAYHFKKFLDAMPEDKTLSEILKDYVTHKELGTYDDFVEGYNKVPEPDSGSSGGRSANDW